MPLAPILVLTAVCGCLSSEPSSIMIRYRVWEEQPDGTRLGCLLDDLRRGGETWVLENFQVVEHGKSLPFSVSSRDGVVATQGRLDREELCRDLDLCEVSFSVLYRKSGAVDCLKVRVEVMDLNDHSPSFPGPLQEVEISESAALRMRMPLDRAVDPDAGSNGLRAYSLSLNQHFALDVTGGPGNTKLPELVVIRELDREVQSSFNLTLVAWDKGKPPKSGSTLVRVHIQDSNDNSPVFEDSSPTVELPEDTARGTTIISLRATDPDQGANGEVEYSLARHTRPDVQKLFFVDSRTGSVSLRAPMDYEARPSYEVVVQARDRGPNAIPSHCKLHVKLTDVNDNAPRIHVTPKSRVATVLEGVRRDTYLALVMVSDADAGDNGRVRAEIRRGSGPFRLKQIHKDNYMILTYGSLDREQVSAYNITLLAYDHGDPPLVGIKHLLVQVLDENDNAPVFSSSVYKASLRENNRANQPVLRVEATDLDLDLSGRVSFFMHNSTDRKFSVHPTSGAVTVTGPLDYEEAGFYSFTVVAVDNGHPPLTSTATVQVHIQDENDNYPAIRDPEPRRDVVAVSVPVNMGGGHIVTEMDNRIEGARTHHGPQVKGLLATTIKAEDADSAENGQVRFRIQDSSGLLWVDQVTGQVFVNTTNATELVGRTLQATLMVTDMGSPPLVTKARLEVSFINLRDHLRNSSPGTRGDFSFTMMLAVCLAATCLLLLLAVALVTTFCRGEKREPRAYNCRQAESLYARHPRRPQKTIRKSDIRLVPVIQRRRDEPPVASGEGRSLTAPPATSEDHQPGTRAFQLLTPHQGDLRPVWRPGKCDGMLSRAVSCRTARNSSVSSSGSRSSTTEAEGHAAPEAEHHRILRNLARLSVAVLGESMEFSSTSPEVQQISQLLSLLHQGRLQPRTNFRGNKRSRRSRLAGQECSDWLSTKDSGRGESEAGDEWESPADLPLEDPEAAGRPPSVARAVDTHSPAPPAESAPCWTPRMSLPLSSDYHDNVFVPHERPSADGELLPRDALDSSSFSTFGKAPEKAGPLCGAMLSEVSTLFEMLMAQKADAHPGPRPDVLYHLSAAYRRSLGLAPPPTPLSVTRAVSQLVLSDGNDQVKRLSWRPTLIWTVAGLRLHQQALGPVERVPVGGQVPKQACPLFLVLGTAAFRELGGKLQLVNNILQNAHELGQSGPAASELHVGLSFQGVLSAAGPHQITRGLVLIHTSAPRHGGPAQPTRREPRPEPGRIWVSSLIQTTRGQVSECWGTLVHLSPPTLHFWPQNFQVQQTGLRVVRDSLSSTTSACPAR
ncbi:LOW QUALITY PROTEIN: protocadherin-12 [Neosynchiropus ocellatus]